MRMGGLLDGQEWNYVMRYFELYDGGAEHVAFQVVATIESANYELKPFVVKVCSYMIVEHKINCYRVATIT